jgi:hypothetical protein
MKTALNSLNANLKGDFLVDPPLFTLKYFGSAMDLCHFPGRRNYLTSKQK